jgi:uncharacterized protein YqgC (DUF456 family)
MNVDLFIPASVILMLIGVFLSLIPVLPGSLVVWGIALAAAYIDNFQRVTPVAIGIMTVIMVISQLSDFWLPLFGVRSGGLTCAASLGSIAGGIVGTLVIPIPLLGTLVGTIVGALIVDYIQRQQVETAVAAGTEAARLFAIGYAVRFVSSVLIFIVFIIALMV